MTVIIVASVGVTLLIVLAAAVAWQERSRLPDAAIVYGVEDSIAFVREGLSSESGAVLRSSDIRRILEWSVHYLQDPAVRADAHEPVVAGGLDAALYVQQRSVDAGVAYDGDLIIEVLALQTEYLSTLGAIGDPVGGLEPDDFG